HASPRLTEKDSIVLSDFVNSTGDPVFDGALRQGLSVQLEQSPYLRLVSEEQVQETLRYMSLPPEAPLTPQVSREICQRTNSTGVLNGTISQVGSEYLITIKALTCVNGELIASTEAQAHSKNLVLDALGNAATEIRRKLGESLNSVTKLNTPLNEATTTSLEALQALNTAGKLVGARDSGAAKPLCQRAIELDPNFAMAHAQLGVIYVNIGEARLAAESMKRAYALRARVSERERYAIEAYYHDTVMGDYQAALQVYNLFVD